MGNPIKKLNELFVSLLILLVINACSTSKPINTTDKSNKETTNSVADSLYEIAWKKFNQKKYIEAGELFEKSIQYGHSWSGTYLNAASSWANANKKHKTFENLNKMLNANYLDKKDIVKYHSEFYQYYDSKEWKKFIQKLDRKRKKIVKRFNKTPIITMSKEEMYQDFDTLIHKIKQISPHLKVREKACNLNFDLITKSIRDEIQNCNSNLDFALLIKRVLITAQDGHTSLTLLNPWSSLADGEAIEKCALIHQFQKNYDSKYVTSTNLPKLIYHKGKYFLASDYTYKSYSFSPKTELIKVNNLSPKDYILKNIDRKRNLSWDFYNQCFYSNYFLQQNIASSETISLSFLQNSDTISFNVNLKLGYIRKNITKPKGGFVWYINKYKLLYINVPRMSNGEFYYNEIVKHKEKDIDKIVIDVRNNPGGNDGTWFYILNAINDVNISFNVETAINNSYNPNSISTEKNIQKIKYLSRKEIKKIPNPPLENINFDGSIFVFYNEFTFSSAGSLVNTSFYTDKLIAVGSKTGKILGFGIKPKQFILPNSRIKYRIEPVLDITNSESYQDIFHDQPEIDVNLNLDEKILMLNNKFTKTFLIENDPYIKSIIKKNYR